MTNNKNRNKSFVPLLLTCVIGCFILFLLWSARQASTGGTDITDRDYYSKGLKYNSTLVEKRAASVIGWKVTSRLKDRQLLIMLTDKNSNPIADASGRLIIGNRNSTSTLLSELSPGKYAVDLPVSLAGEFPVRVEFERQGARISRQLLLNIGN